MSVVRGAVLALAVASVLAAACTPAATPTAARAPGREKSADPYPSGAPRAALAWATFDAAIFARAKQEHRFVLLDGAAEWCHFCHVMEAETYHDPEVRALLDGHFLAAKVDVDARPDIEERYAAWGWPATVIFSPEGEELGKYRGYIPPAEMRSILRAVVEHGGEATHENEVARPPTPPAALGAVQHFAELELEEYWDDQEGGWGGSPKVPLAGDVAWALERGRAGDKLLADHARTALEKERKIIDPVWGGIYQYSVARDWDHPHYEKLMLWNAGALENYARAYELTKDARALESAKAIRGYLEAFLLAPSGAFHGSQDADLNAHDTSRPYLDGHAYYAKGDKERRALGIPRVDPHEYASDTGLALVGYAAFAKATADEGARIVAHRALHAILETHATTRGGVTHDADPTARVLYLADNAALGLGLVRFDEVSRDSWTLGSAMRIADFLLADLTDPKTGAFFAHTADDAAVGIFAVRRRPFDDNVTAIRFLNALGLMFVPNSAQSARYRGAALRALCAISDPAEVKSQGKFLGAYLSALDETRDLWTSAAAPAPAPVTPGAPVGPAITPGAPPAATR